MQIQQPHLVQEGRGPQTTTFTAASQSSGLSFNGMRLIEAVADDGSGRTIYIAIPSSVCFRKSSLCLPTVQSTQISRENENSYSYGDKLFELKFIIENYELLESFDQSHQT